MAAVITDKSILDQRREEIGRIKLSLVNAPQQYRDGIEVFPLECKVSNGECECLYCTQIISAKSFQRTCPVCATKWRKEYGAEWYLSSWHTDLLDAHKALWSGRKPSGEVTEDAVLVFPIDPDEKSDTRAVVTAIREVHKYGAKRILEELATINKQRAERGAEPYPVPTIRAVEDWISQDYSKELYQEELTREIKQMHTSGNSIAKIHRTLAERGEKVSVSTVRRWLA